MTVSRRRPPWKRPNPRAKSRRRRLTAGQKTAARRRAKRAGRRYPNLVDNMQAASRAAKGRKTKDPRGGLTAAGRAEFARKTGARLKPGVRKKQSEMTPQEMRRKGSWAVRFYGRAGKLPPLKDKSGKPTRFALTAAAWGEPVPRTATAARKIADKGRRLLRLYKRVA